MNILAFDTCFDGCSACVAERRGGVVIELAAVFERFQTGHAQRLIPMIGEVMQQARVSFDQIDRIAVTVGPGTFTGRASVLPRRARLLLSAEPRLWVFRALRSWPRPRGRR